ncbi:MAG: hypothetical protein ACXWQO_18555, partial [Bdellovibrionota bacterium]
GGGNATVAEFYLYIRSFAAIAQKHPKEVSGLISVEKLATVASSVLVEAKPSPLLLNGNKVDAINFPSQNKIQVDDTTWSARGIHDKYQIVVHELLGLLSVADPGFQVSEKITASTLALSPFQPVRVNSCVDSTGKDISQDLNAIVALIAQQTSCNTASMVANACSWGTSGDVRKAWTAYRICEAELAKDKPSDENRAQLQSMEGRCESRYAAKWGTMYESLNAYCHLEAMHWVVELSTDWSK